MQVARTPADLRAVIAGWQRQGQSVGLVPTMGALHEGHLSLVTLAKQKADRAVATIFVNPAQFGPNEDFQRYPRQEDADLALLESAGCDLAYLPGVEVMYPKDFATSITVAGVSQGLCGDCRPGHFAGVATVVTKLLLQALPDLAVFGEKDYQQLQVIKRLVADLDIPVRILGAPTLREADGLAKSSRNAYLTPEERRLAPLLFRQLSQAAQRIHDGAGATETCRDVIRALLAAGFDKADYVEVRDAATLAAIEHAKGPARILAALWLGRTRLIDNLPID
ncbi:MAG: pantoate--beta-alanine ligase [Rhodospirillales bacterium]|nr:pantoate--beta-alanine ligase [Rhodospirillales bacterium]MDK9721394.1 pantoate--beta-alanine ligase [Rhodospirillales bacterium]